MTTPTLIQQMSDIDLSLIHSTTIILACSASYRSALNSRMAYATNQVTSHRRNGMAALFDAFVDSGRISADQQAAPQYTPPLSRSQPQTDTPALPSSSSGGAPCEDSVGIIPTQSAINERSDQNPFLEVTQFYISKNIIH